FAEEAREEVAEIAEIERRRGEAPGAKSRVAVPVVELARLGVGEHLVRLGHLAEALLGVGLLRHVGMELPRQPPERFLDLLLVGIPRDPEQLVVVAFRRRHRRTWCQCRWRATPWCTPPRRSARARAPPRGRCAAPSRSPCAAAPAGSRLRASG